MSAQKSKVVHELRLSRGALVLAVAAILALALHALVPLVRPGLTQAESMPRTINMSCRWNQPPASEHPVEVESTCVGSTF